MKTLCFTGPRPKRENNYKIPNEKPIFERFRDVISRAYGHNFRTFIFGGAIGIDQLAMEAAVSKLSLYPDMKLVCARPFPSQHVRWPKHVQDEFLALIGYMDVVDVSPDPYSAKKMMIRNEFMVDLSDVIVAIYDSIVGGGTKNCVDYAIAQAKMVLTINPKSLEEEWITP